MDTNALLGTYSSSLGPTLWENSLRLLPPPLTLKDDNTSSASNDDKDSVKGLLLPLSSSVLFSKLSSVFLSLAVTVPLIGIAEKLTKSIGPNLLLADWAENLNLPCLATFGVGFPVPVDIVINSGTLVDGVNISSDRLPPNVFLDGVNIPSVVLSAAAGVNIPLAVFFVGVEIPFRGNIPPDCFSIVSTDRSTMFDELTGLPPSGDFLLNLLAASTNKLSKSSLAGAGLGVLGNCLFSAKLNDTAFLTVFWSLRSEVRSPAPPAFLLQTGC